MDDSPAHTELSPFFVDEEVMNPLIETGLVNKAEDELINNSTARYELTEEGKALADELSKLTDQESLKMFIARVKPIKP